MLMMADEQFGRLAAKFLGQLLDPRLTNYLTLHYFDTRVVMRKNLGKVFLRHRARIWAFRIVTRFCY